MRRHNVLTKCVTDSYVSNKQNERIVEVSMRDSTGGRLGGFLMALRTFTPDAQRNTTGKDLGVVDIYCVDGNIEVHGEGNPDTLKVRAVKQALRDHIVNGDGWGADACAAVGEAVGWTEADDAAAEEARDDLADDTTAYTVTADRGTGTTPPAPTPPAPAPAPPPMSERGYYHTYEVTTAESAEDGDVAERGYVKLGGDVELPDGLVGPAFTAWRLENELLVRIDVDGVDDPLYHVRCLAANILAHSCTEHSSSEFDPGGWYTSEAKQDMHTGAWRSESVHPVGFSAVELWLVRMLVKSGDPFDTLVG